MVAAVTDILSRELNKLLRRVLEEPGRYFDRYGSESAKVLYQFMSDKTECVLLIVANPMKNYASMKLEANRRNL